MSSTRSSTSRSVQAVRGAFLDFVDDPFYVSELESVRYVADGLLVIAEGAIVAFGTYADLHSQYADVPVTAYPGKLIMPGFIDTHIHFPQLEMIAAVWGTAFRVAQSIHLSNRRKVQR